MTLPTPTIDLSHVSMLSEIVVRMGNAKDSQARMSMQRAYVRPDPNYPGIAGLSTLFHPGASLDDLARAASQVLNHRKLSWSIVQHLMGELAQVSYELVLYITPNADLPDHHTLAVAIAGVVQPILADAAAEALIRALDVADNPYQRPRP